MMKFSRLSLFFLLLASSVVLTSGVAKAAVPYYTNNPLIADSIFLNANAMSPAQIQQFLADKQSSLTNYYVTESSATEALTYYPNYNRSVLASQAIYDAGQVYGINPQVILATMQKEQSLITAQNPAASQLRYAMGYGCPDSAGCSSAAAGLFYQIDNGTFDLRFLYERARGNNNWWNGNSYPCRSTSRYYSPGLFPGNNVTFYDDAGTAYTSFVMSNPSTASMYCYTPHAYPGSAAQYFSGSYNFVVAFTTWFGSTLSGVQMEQASGDSTVYVVYGGAKQAIPSGDVLSAWGLDRLPVSTVTASYISSLPSRGVLTRLARNPFNGDQYLLADNGGTFDALSTMVSDWGMNPAAASSVGGELIAYTARLGSLSQFITYNGTSGIFMVDGGSSRQFASGSTLQSWAGNTRVAVVSQALFAQLSSGSGIFSNQAASPSTNYFMSQGSRFTLDATTSALYPRNAVTSVTDSLAGVLPTAGNASRLVKGSGGTIYLVDGATKHAFPSLDLLDAYMRPGDPITTIDDNALSQIPDGQLVFSHFAYSNVDSTKQYYAAKRLLTLQPSVFAANTYGFAMSPAGLQALDSAPTAISCVQGFIQAQGNSTVFKLENGQRRGITSPAALSLLAGPDAGGICSLAPDDVNRIPGGTVIMPFAASGGTNYLLEQGKRYTVNSTVAQALGNPVFIPVTAGTLANYTDSGALTQGFVVDGQYVFLDSGRWFITPSERIGRSWLTAYTSHSNAILGMLTYGGLLQTFATGQSGSIYGGTVFAAGNGSAWGIVNPDHAANLGFYGAVTQVSDATLSAMISPRAWQGYLAYDEGGGTWVLDGGVRREVTGSTATTWTTGQTPTAIGNPFLATIPIGQPMGTALRAAGNPTIFGMRDGKKYAFTSPSALANSGLPAPVTISNSLMNAIPTGGIW